jgi:hypothetical protein
MGRLLCWLGLHDRIWARNWLLEGKVCVRCNHRARYISNRRSEGLSIEPGLALERSSSRLRKKHRFSLDYGVE